MTSTESLNGKDTNGFTSIENKFDKGPYKGQESEDSEEEPDFPFEYRGKQVGESAGLATEQTNMGGATKQPDKKVNDVKDAGERDALDKRAAEEMAKKKKKKGKS